MNNCPETIPYYSSCFDELGGFQEAYIQKYDRNLVFTYTSGTGENGITYSQISGFTGSTGPAMVYEQLTNEPSFTYEVADTANVFTQTVALTIHKLTPVNANRIKILRQGLYRVYLLDNNGQFWLAGKVRGGRFTVTGGFGVNVNDPNTSVVTFTGYEAEPLYPVSQAAMQSIIQG